MKNTSSQMHPNDKRHTLIGQKFGRLRVIGISDRKGYVICECECGNNTETRPSCLKNKKRPARSCGCLKRESIARIGHQFGRNNCRAMAEVNARYNTNFQVIERTSLHKNNTSGKTGVCWDKRSSKWMAYIQVHRKQITLGLYTSLDDAIKARLIAEDKYHKPLIEAKIKEVVDV